MQQMRLFFRYQESETARVIVLAWVNDESTLRAYGESSDAYVVFGKMLKRGCPPDDWETLLASASEERARAVEARALTPGLRGGA